MTELDQGHFLNLMSHGFMRVAVAVPRCRVADPAFNAQASLTLLREAAGRGAAVVVFPELGLSAYSCDDLFHQQVLQQACIDALATLLEASRELACVAAVGLPLAVEGRLYNVAALFARGRLLGLVPKTYLPNYAEFYEARQFAAADQALVREVDLLGQRVPFGSELVFECTEQPHLKLHAEICEDVWTPVPPSCHGALAGATVLLNLSASNALVGKAAYRQQLVAQQSARCLAAYLYSASGPGESTTDLAWDGHGIVCENGERLAESRRYAEAHVITADIDLQRLAHERMRQTSFGDSVRRHAPQLQGFRRVRFELGLKADAPLPLRRRLERFPYVPAGRAQRDERCREVVRIQVQGLVQRLESSGIRRLVVGISGGLDSTHALLVAAQAMDHLKRPRSDILAYTMPGYATSQRTRQQAHALMQAVGCQAEEIDIRPSCEQMFKDIGHPYADGHPVYDVTFENVQAGERTSHLFRLANRHGGMVLGTGDLSELALGWCTYGVGDHMSHYNVNASVPKTLIRHLVRWVAERADTRPEVSRVLQAILDTEISPELVPTAASARSAGAGELPAQSTEATVGLYELQDFNLYQVLRHGHAPRKVAFLALSAWGDAAQGAWPDEPQGPRHAHDLATIKATLKIFVARFFKGSQFKRSCVPNGPKVGSGGSLSPRGDWRAPSDGESAPWLADLARIPEALTPQERQALTDAAAA